MKEMDPAFEVHMLNQTGKVKALAIAHEFDDLYRQLLGLCGKDSDEPEEKPTREMAIVKTKLEEACFFAKKAMANRARNQELKFAEKPGETTTVGDLTWLNQGKAPEIPKTS